MGGSGFLGLRLAAALLDDAGLSICEVRLLDIRAPEGEIPFAPSSKRVRHKIGSERLKFIACDLRDASSVSSALTGVDTVFHLASYGMSGREMLHTALIRSVNIGGTENVLAACRERGVARCIYVSTYNTVFISSPIINGSEDEVAYGAMESFHEEYSRSKRVAEEMVLKANNSIATATAAATVAGNGTKSVRSSPTPLTGAKTAELATCVLRPAAIYGDGESRHFPRILSTVSCGFGFAAIGSPDTLCDWVFVDNLTHALLLAASSLATSSGSAAGLQSSRAAGQSYCISDENPINNFDFLRPFCEGLGYKETFRFWLPFRAMFLLAWALELLRLLLLSICPSFVSRACGNFHPFLSRAEVCKVGVTHFFSMRKAREHFGYRRLIEPARAREMCVEFYMTQYGTKQAKRKFQREQEEKARREGTEGGEER